MTKVMVFGTFDILHKGHEFLFTEAKKYGDVTAVVALDATVEKLKGNKPKYTQEERLNAVQGDNSVDKAILGNSDDYYQVILDEQPDIICLGYDQELVSLDEEKLKELGVNAKIIRLDSFEPEKYKSSKMKT